MIRRLLVTLALLGLTSAGYLHWPGTVANAHTAVIGGRGEVCQVFANNSGRKSIHACIATIIHKSTRDGYHWEGYGGFVAINTGIADAQKIEVRYVRVWSRFTSNSNVWCDGDAANCNGYGDWPDMAQWLPWALTTGSNISTGCFVHIATQVRIMYGATWAKWQAAWNSKDVTLPHPCGLDL